VAVEHLRDAPYDAGSEEARAITMEIISTLKELLHMHPIYNEQLRRRALSAPRPRRRGRRERARCLRCVARRTLRRDLRG